MKASDFHLPSSLMVYDGMPLLAASVAAPILKLWALKSPLNPAASHSLFRCALNQAADMGDPSCFRNRGPIPPDRGRTAKYSASSFRGQLASEIALKLITAPSRLVSPFDSSSLIKRVS